jgi:hypothetical protein
MPWYMELSTNLPTGTLESSKKKLAIKAADRVERINQLCTTHKTITSMANELSITMQALAVF